MSSQREGNAMSDTAVDRAETATNAQRVRFGQLVFDTPDPTGLGYFYAQLLGWDVTYKDDEWVKVQGPAGQSLGFQLAPDLIRSTWPDGAIPQQAHLDLYVSEYDGAEAHAIALGATVLDVSSEHPGFRVYADPSGHPFCLCLADPNDP